MPPRPTSTPEPNDARSGWSDHHLVDAVLGGDTDAFRFLVARQAGQVTAVCRRILADPTEAEDVAQEAFLRAYRALGTYRGDGPFGAWISRIAARQAIGRLDGRPMTALLDEVAYALPSARAGDHPEAVTLEAEQRDAIREAVACLPRPQRDVVELRFFGDLSLEEIARTTRIPVGTVKSRLHRGLASLRASLPTRSQQ